MAPQARVESRHAIGGYRTDLRKETMPELPEVENVVTTLAPGLLGATIERAVVLCAVSVGRPSPDEFASRIAGRQVLGLSRRGKYILVALGGGLHLVAHLRMTGALLLSPDEAPQPRFARVALVLVDGRVLWFADLRKFGRLWLVGDPSEVLPDLGPEPFDPALDAASLHGRLQHCRRPVKSLLLDQAFVAGLGNIYADEALFVAGIHPCRPASALSQREATSLLEAIRRVLADGIANRGTTIANYVDANGRPGENQEQLLVYGRAGQECPRCGGKIGRLRLAGRNAAFCPRCQRR